jgi:hypothetical protein
MTTLAPAEVQALHEALDDEYQAWATYNQVVADFGEVRPFINIRESEARHIATLERLFTTYGLPVPPSTWPGRVPRYASLQEACEAGVAAEVANGAMYERLLAATSRPDILAVFRNLQEASQERHLEAFRRCAQRRGAGRGCGEGRGRRNRHRCGAGQGRGTQ